MIKNLPRYFPLSALDKFDFGDADAQQDNLLSECPVPTASIAEFLTDKKDIVLGYRGTGKSAMVRLITEGKLCFPSLEGCSPVVLALTEEFSFQLISGIIRRNGQARDNKLVSRIVWEILIIYRALQEVREKHGDIDPNIKAHLDDLDALLGVIPRRQSFIQVLLNAKKKIGVKLDSSLPTVIDMYAGIEPAQPVQASPEPVTLRLIEYKRDLNRILQENKLTLYVLFDRLDDFVAHEDYDTQRLLLHGLLATQLDYRQKYPRVRIKAFIRTDLFRKLDLSDFGPDKIYSRTVTLAWSPSEIKHFLANRIALNLMRSLDIPSLQVALDKDEFQVSRRELADLRKNKASVANRGVFSLGFWRGLVWLTKLNKRKRREYEARLRNSSEVINEKIVTAIFQRKSCTADSTERTRRWACSNTSTLTFSLDMARPRQGPCSHFLPDSSPGFAATIKPIRIFIASRRTRTENIRFSSSSQSWRRTQNIGKMLGRFSTSGRTHGSR